MKHLTFAVVTIALVLSLSACSESPFQPDGPPPPPPPPPPPAPAVLVISDFTITVGHALPPPYTPGERVLKTRFTLSETGRSSGATLMKIQFSHEGVLDTYYPDELCWESTPSVRVEAGATLNTFGTLWGLPPVGNYCAPTTRGVPPTQVGIIVTFVDDLGVSGTVEATTFVE